MKKWIIPIAALAFLIACKSGQTGNGSDPSSVAAAPASEGTSSGSGSDSMGRGGPSGSFADSVNRCYLYATGKDSIRMKLTQTGQSVSGELSYHLDAKDANTGNFDGVMKGDTLVANYTFKSEGKVSQRQEVMLRQGGDFIIGSGATKDQNGKQVFTDMKQVKFDKLKLTLTNCSQ